MASVPEVDSDEQHHDNDNDTTLVIYATFRNGRPTIRQTIEIPHAERKEIMLRVFGDKSPLWETGLAPGATVTSEPVPEKKAVGQSAGEDYEVTSNEDGDETVAVGSNATFSAVANDDSNNSLGPLSSDVDDDVDDLVASLQQGFDEETANDLAAKLQREFDEETAVPSADDAADEIGANDETDALFGEGPLAAVEAPAEAPAAERPFSGLCLPPPSAHKKVEVPVAKRSRGDDDAEPPTAKRARTEDRAEASAASQPISRALVPSMDADADWSEWAGRLCDEIAAMGDPNDWDILGSLQAPVDCSVSMPSQEIEAPATVVEEDLYGISPAASPTISRASTATLEANRPMGLHTPPTSTEISPQEISAAPLPIPAAPTAVLQADRTLPPPQLTIKEEINWRCRYCADIMGTKYTYREHMLKVHNLPGTEPFHECGICTKKFKAESDRERHCNRERSMCSTDDHSQWNITAPRTRSERGDTFYYPGDGKLSPGILVWVEKRKLRHGEVKEALRDVTHAERPGMIRGPEDVIDVTPIAVSQMPAPGNPYKQDPVIDLTKDD